MISIDTPGSFKKTEDFLRKMARNDLVSILQKYGQRGVDALSNATPRESGETASSWIFEVVQQRKYVTLIWRNTHVVDGVPIAIILQYGHGTGTGGYVQGYDYINPAIRPIFDEITTEVWREVTNG